MIGETVAQVKGTKPRFRPTGTTSEITRQRVSELSEAYLEARNRKLRSQAFLAEAQAREKAGELLSKELVIRQAQYIIHLPATGDPQLPHEIRPSHPGTKR